MITKARIAPDDWDRPHLVSGDPFLHFLGTETHLAHLSDLGMPQEEIRELRQENDIQLMDLHAGYMALAVATGVEPPQLFGWGDENYRSCT